MLRNYLIIAWRNLVRHKLYSLINITGLAVGMACCVLIMIFVQNELSFDQFHEHAERIHLVCVEFGTEERTYQSQSAPVQLAESLAEAFPEVVQATTIRRIGPQLLVRHGEKSFREDGLMLADEHLFAVLSFSFVRGDPATALPGPSSMVVTRSAAQKFFGDEDPLGKVLQVSGKDVAPADFAITAVVENLPHNSHLQPDFLLPFEYFHGDPNFNRGYTLVLLDEGAAPEALEGKFSQLARTLPDAQKRKTQLGDTVYRVYLEPLRGLHLRFSPVSRYSIYIFSALALLILLLACINYMNLATAQAAGRAKEIGVRKVVGALRWQLLGQFLSEALLMSCIALVLAVALVEGFLPVFNDFLKDLPVPQAFNVLGSELSMQWKDDGRLWLGLAGIALLVGVVSGSYPALFLSTFKPVRVLKGRLRLGARGSLLRRGLVTIQFAASSVLILVVVAMYLQLNFVRSEGLGFDQEQVVVLPLHGVTTDKVIGHGYLVSCQSLILG